MFDDRIGNLQKMLARMGPEGRQRYAADHSDDPIAVSMALFVNNIAKELKEGKRGEPEMQAPVVQQAIQAMNQPRMPQGMPPQGMPPQGQPQAPQAMPQQQAPQMAANGGYMDSRLPEEMGIGALPERSLSNMADGGIVGFADRGLVPDLPGGAIERARRAIQEKRAAEERLTPRRGYMTTPEIYDQDTQNAYQQPQETPANVAQQTALPPALPSAAPAAPPSTAARATPPAAAPRPAAATAARPTAGAGTTNVPTGAGLASLASQYDSINTAGMSGADILAARAQFEKGIAAVDPVASERAALNTKSKMFSEQALTDFEKEIKDRPDPYAKREERANKQEANIAESAERNPYLSLMEAGFAMMSGTSQYAFENIGKGALVGTKAYKDGLDKIEKAKEKLSETRDKIEDYRINRDDLTAKERRAFKTDIRNTELEGDKNLIAGLALAFNRKDAEVAAAMKAVQDSHNNAVNRRAQVDTAKVNELGAGQRLEYSTDAQVRMSNADRSARVGEAAANRKMQEKIAGMPGATQQLILALGEGNIKEGYRLYNERPKQDDALFLDWSKRSEDPYTGEEFRKRYPTAQVYVEAARRNGTGVVDVDTPLRTR